jgi:hypothetical protein
MSKFEQFKRRLRPGQVYRRADLAEWSSAVDRHLKARAYLKPAAIRLWTRWRASLDFAVAGDGEIFCDLYR